MAEEVKIVDVAGGPAAEATLQELLKVMKAKAGGSGGGSGDVMSGVAAATGLYTAAVTRGTTSKKSNTKATKEGTSALQKFANGVGGFVSGAWGLFTGAIGATIGAATNLVKAFGDGTGTLTDMVSAIPGIGTVLGMFTGYLDNTLTVFQQLSSSGASFNNNLTELRISAAGAKVSLESFASLIGSNTENLAAFGGTVTQGAQQFGRVRKAFRAHEQEMLNMGMTFEEMNESIMDYMALNRAGSRAQAQDNAQLAAHAASYSKSLMTLSKLTGEDVKAQREKLAAQQNDIAFQMALAKLRPEERAKVQAGLAEAMAAGGETGAEYFRQQFLGLPPLTEATAMFESTMGQSAAAIREMNRQALDAGTSLDEYNAGAAGRLADFVEGQARAGADFESILTAAAGGLEGPAADLANIMNGAGINFTKYLDENGNFNRQLFEQDIAAAQAENAERDEAVDALTSFQSTLRSIKEAFETNVLAPITKAVGPQLSKLADLFKDTEESTLRPVFDKIGVMITQFTTDIENFGIGTALSNLMTNIGDAAKPVFESMIDSLKSMIFGQSAEEVRADLQATKESLSATRTSIQDQINALNTQLPNLQGANADAARTQIANLQSQLAEVDTQIASTDEQMAGATDSSGLFGDMFGGLWDKVKEMDWGTVALALGGLGVAIVGLGYAAGPIVAPLLAIGAAMAGIGLGAAGVASLVDSISNSVGNLADGVKKFEDLDSGKLLDVGNALGPLTSNIMELAQGGIVASFVGEGALEGLADGVRAFEGLDASNLIPIGFAIQGLGDPIKEIAGAGFFANFVSDGALEGLAAGVKAFEAVDPTQLAAVGPAMRALHEGIAAFTGDGVLDSVSKGVGGFISSLFGDEEGQFDALIEGLKKFEEVNADAIYKVGTGLVGLKDFAAGDVDLGEISISADGLARLNDITKTLDADAINRYNEALEKLVDVLTDLNEELGGDTTGAGAGGAGSAASGVLGNMSSMSGESGNEEMQRNRMVLMQILEELRTANKYHKKTASGVNGDLQLGV
jgi:hypothetical protein